MKSSEDILASILHDIDESEKLSLESYTSTNENQFQDDLSSEASNYRQKYFKSTVTGTNSRKQNKKKSGRHLPKYLRHVESKIKGDLDRQKKISKKVCKSFCFALFFIHA